MSYSKQAILALALASVASAATSCSASDPTTVTDPAGLQSIVACPTWTGDIAVQTGAATGGLLDFGSTLKKISGALSVIGDSSITTINGAALQNVGDVTFNKLTSLSGVSFSQLVTTGNIDFETVSFQAFDFGQGLQTVNNVKIVNTQLSSISGISSATSVGSFTIQNNPFLALIESNVSKIDTVSISGNDKANGGFQVNFPSLKTANAVQIGDASSITLGSLVSTSKTLEVDRHAGPSVAFPKLTTVGSFFINASPQLSNLSIPLLANTTIGAFAVQNNTALLSLSAPALTRVTADIRLNGKFANVTFPKLAFVSGTVSLSTSDPNFDCSTINNYQNMQVSGGASTCTPGSSNTTGSSTGDGSSGSSGSTGGTTSTGAANILGLPSAIGGTSVLAILLTYLI